MAGLTSRVGIALVLLSTALVACAPKGKPRPVNEDDLPPWMTDPLAVKLDVAKRLVEQGNPYALGIIRDLREESSIPPGELDYLQGKALRNEGLHDESERLLLSATKRLGRDPRPHDALCVLYADTRRTDEALAACKTALDIDDDVAATWNNYGYLLLAADRTTEALAAMQKAVELDSSEARYRNNLALAQAAAGKVDDALRTFMSTGSRAYAHYNVGTALERHGDPAQARVHYDEALALDARYQAAREAIERLDSAPPRITEPEPEPQTPTENPEENR